MGVCREAWQSSSVPQGCVRIAGHFCGSVTTDTHCLDVALPVEYDVPLAVLEPLLAVFAAADAPQEAEEERPQERRRAEGEAPRPEEPRPEEEPRPRLRVLWGQLKAIIVGSTANGAAEIAGLARAKGLPQVPGFGHSLPEPLPSSSQASEALRRLQSQEAALEVDYHARDALVRQLVEERDALREENSRLRGDSPLRSTRPSVRFGAEEEQHQGRPPSSSKDKAVEAEAKGRKGRKEQREQSATGDALADEAQEVPEGCIRISGHFSGCATTKAHFLDIVLPLHGTFPGGSMLQVVRGLAEGAKRESQRPGGDGEAEERLGLTWGELATLLQAEYPPGPEAQASVAAAPAPQAIHQEPQPEAGGPARLARALAAANSELKELRAKLGEAWEELTQLHGENTRVQCEAETLRSRNASLTALLASAESAAVMTPLPLRNAQRQGALQALQAAAARRPMSPRQQGSLAMRQLSPMEAVAARGPMSPRQLGSPVMRQLSPREAGGPLRQRAASPVGAWRALPAAAGGGRLPRETSPLGHAVAVEAAKEHKALVADLRELERWAHELRMLSG